VNLFILDTDILTLYREGHPSLCTRILQHAPQELAVTVITVEEQLSGWYALLRRARSPNQLASAYQRLTDTVQFLSGLRIFSFTQPAIARYDQLKTLRINVGSWDLRIAAIALEHAATLVTRNTRDFQRVPGLVLEDWTR
jgi:tRNA(fMet)-specific endonuclease VapC